MTTRVIVVGVVAVCLSAPALYGQSLGDIAAAAAKRRAAAAEGTKPDPAAPNARAAKTFTNADLPFELPEVPCVPSTDPQLQEARLAVRAVQSALSGGANASEFKKYFLEAKVKIDAMPHTPVFAGVRAVLDVYEDAVTLSIADLVGTLRKGEAHNLREKYGADLYIEPIVRHLSDEYDTTREYTASFAYVRFVEQALILRADELLSKASC